MLLPVIQSLSLKMKKLIRMKMKAMIRISMMIMLVASIVSCVPVRQLRLSENRVAELAGLNQQLEEANHRLAVDNTELASRVRVLEAQVARLTSQADELQRSLNASRERYNRLDESYQNLLKVQQELAAGSDAEVRKILSELQVAQRDLQAREDALRKLESEIQLKKSNLEKLQEQFEDQRVRLTELERILAQKDSVMNALQQVVARALFDFSPDELRVEMRNGLLYVSMEEKLLFRSGSFEVGSKGVDAVQKLARVLEKHPDIQIMVEGHTDNVPYRASSTLLQDNWDLSVKRATSIIRILLQGSTIDPQRLNASGRGEFIPVDSNDNPEGRQKNRRTEIVLSPRLDDLYRLMQR